MIRRNSARFACREVQKYKSEDFLEGGFFGGEVEYRIPTLAPPSRARVESLLPTC